MSTQTIFITGATEGMVKLLHLILQYKKKTLLFLFMEEIKRSLDKTVDEIKKASSNQNIVGYLADFSRLDDVRWLAKDILSKHDTIDILINNAGAGFAAPRYWKD